ncbi:hypothetical protein NMEN69166_1028 [Neisseria meningitidis 69166]|nr:hypothetical protein NMEN69166_1028 [Neisseria meningitidis 69166]
MNLVKLLANNWQPIAIIALVGTLLAVSHHQGYKSAFAKQQAVIDKMEKRQSASPAVVGSKLRPRAGTGACGS